MHFLRTLPLRDSVSARGPFLWASGPGATISTSFISFSVGESCSGGGADEGARAKGFWQTALMQVDSVRLLMGFFSHALAPSSVYRVISEAS